MAEVSEDSKSTEVEGLLADIRGGKEVLVELFLVHSAIRLAKGQRPNPTCGWKVDKVERTFTLYVPFEDRGKENGR